MRILLCNKFYYRRGGDCIYTMNLEQLLKAHGHEVAVYAMNYPQNEASPWSKYWPSNMSKLDAFTRPFGAGQVKKGFTQLLEDFKPDVVHLNNIHTQLSPVIAEIAHRKGIRVVWTLHDTKLVCPCYTCMRRNNENDNENHNEKHNENDKHNDNDNENHNVSVMVNVSVNFNQSWCEECFSSPISVIKHRCMPGSVPGAVIGYFELKKWNKERLQACTDLFLPPSQFMMDTVVRGGYDARKFKVLCNFIDVNKVQNPSFKKEDYYVFLGRVSAVKGIRTLCAAASQLPYKLKVIGGGELLDELKAKYKDNTNIEFLGQMDWADFRPILEAARFMVLPAEWSENNPLTIIESQSLGTPVLGAHIGGIPELINENANDNANANHNANDNANHNANDNENANANVNDASQLSSISSQFSVPNGMTFESGNLEDLKQKITQMFHTEFDYPAIAHQAVTRYSSEAYYDKLIEIYKGNN